MSGRKNKARSKIGKHSRFFCTANKLINKDEFMKFKERERLQKREGIFERTRGFFVDFFNFLIWQHKYERGSERKLGEATLKLQNYTLLVM